MPQQTTYTLWYTRVESCLTSSLLLLCVQFQFLYIMLSGPKGGGVLWRFGFGQHCAVHLKAGAGGRARMAVALAPVPLWLAAISALPHKEERFLYVIYPLVRLQTKVATLSKTPTQQTPLWGGSCWITCE